MFGRLFPPSLESHDLVTTVLRRGGDPDLSLLSEPLELLCRDLDGPAKLHAAGRKRARQRLIDALRRAPRRESAEPSPVDGMPPGPAALVIVAGLPGQRRDALIDALIEALIDARLQDRAPAPPVQDEDATLESLLRSMTFDEAWHLPQWAEWFEQADHRTSLTRLRSAADHPDRPVLLTNWQHLERLDQLVGGTRALVVMVDEPIDDVADRWIPKCVEQRRRWSNDVDPQRVARYWSWRLHHARDRAEANWDSLDADTLRFGRSAIDHDLEAVVPTIVDRVRELAAP